MMVMMIKNKEMVERAEKGEVKKRQKFVRKEKRKHLYKTNEHFLIYKNAIFA